MRDLGESGAVTQLPRDVIPLFDLAQRALGRNPALGHLVQNGPHIALPHPPQDHQRLARQPDVDQRLFGAEAEATGAGDRETQPQHLDGVGEGVIDALGPVARAARPHPNRDARLGRKQFGEPRLARGVETAQVGDLHYGFPFFSAWSSRSRVLSFTWPRMAWSTSTTGAKAHCPKQATVRSVKRRSGVVAETLSALPSSSWFLNPSCSLSRSSRLREPRVWQAVPRQMQMV